MEVEVNILKSKLEEKDKHLQFQESTKILDNILNSQRSLAIKSGLGFHETVEGESSSQAEARNLKSNNAKLEILNKEIISQPDQQPKKVKIQRKSFTPNYINVNRFSPLINNVECSICHNYGHIVANCRSRIFQANNRLTERSSTSNYFKGYCFSWNIFGHKAIDCNRRNMKHKYYDCSAHIRCYACNKFGHVAKECRNKSMDHHIQHGKQPDKNIDVRRPKKEGSTNISHNKQKEEEHIRCGLALFSFEEEDAWYIDR